MLSFVIREVGPILTPATFDVRYCMISLKKPVECGLVNVRTLELSHGYFYWIESHHLPLITFPASSFVGYLDMCCQETGLSLSCCWLNIPPNTVLFSDELWWYPYLLPNCTCCMLFFVYLVIGEGKPLEWRNPYFMRETLHSACKTY